jgi:hypothetical protein
MRKGILFTLLSLFMSMTVLSVATLYAGQTQTSDIPLRKTSMIYYDLVTDYESLTGTRAQVSSTTWDTKVTLFNTMGVKDAALKRARYQAHLLSYLQSQNTHATLELNRPAHTITPHNITVDSPTIAKNIIRVYNISGGLNVPIDVSLSLSESLVNFSREIMPGDVRVNLTLNFPNNQTKEQYHLSPTGKSVFTYNTVNSTIMVEYGGNEIGLSQHNNSLILSKTGSDTPETAITLHLPPGPEAAIHSDSRICIRGEVSACDNIRLK